MTVNYCIACCSHRAARDDIGGTRGCDTLKLHIEQLLNSDTTKLAQVTILRALPLIRDSSSPANIILAERYWDIDDLVSKLKCPVVIMDVKDVYFSYSSWIQACQYYRDKFDYYILVEDDYYPVPNNFVDLLIELHAQKLPDGGYLCGYVHKNHAAVSNGIVDSETFVKALDMAQDPIQLLSLRGAQGAFLCPDVFGNAIADYTDTHRTLFWGGNNEIIEMRRLKQDIFNPIQCLANNQK